MDKLLKVGIVGCGAIGTSLAKAIIEDLSHKSQLSALYDLDIEKAYNLAHAIDNQKLVALNLESLINKADLVIEATKADSAVEIIKKTISASKDIMIMSVGGIVENYKELFIMAQEKNRHIFIPSGAICGIDGLKAAACGKINKVTLTTKKPAKAFLGTPYVLKQKIRLDNLSEDIVIFEGDAFSAIRAFPQNINVAVTLSIAGVGPRDTLIRIIASPKIDKNIHEVEIISDSGKIVTRTENVVHPDNPKTSYLAVLSAVATLKQILEPVKVGS
jgi:aspartate dehydrogenase